MTPTYDDIPKIGFCSVNENQNRSNHVLQVGYAWTGAANEASYQG